MGSGIVKALGMSFRGCLAKNVRTKVETGSPSIGAHITTRLG